jgi:hypothetical protein
MALERGDWPHVERCCEALARFTAAEPLPQCDLYIGRAHALMRHRRGERDPALATALGALRTEAARLDIRLMLPALDAALMRW